jgi:lysophospholipase L1-like esterase
MTLPRLIVSTACAVTLSAAAVSAAGPASAATINYVALGDSYSSGVGAGSYDSSGCKRSSHSYAAQWAALYARNSFTFAACSGAKTTDVINNQLGSLGSSTSLVSITIGGNDAGFSNAMQTCVLDSDSACLSAVNTAENYMDTQLPGNLKTVFSAIRSKAPAAQVVVLDYPHLYITNDGGCVGMSHTKHVALNSAADKLDTVISKGAANAGFSFADVRGQFAGHELCSGDDWLNSVTIPIGESYHPTALGQTNGYLPVFRAAAGAATR